MRLFLLAPLTPYKHLQRPLTASKELVTFVCISFSVELYKRLFKQTAIYGIATVLPRMLSFLLVGLYTSTAILPDRALYGEATVLFAYMVFFNVVLSYGMETAFFRYYSEENKSEVVSTALISIFWTTLVFLVAALLFRNTLAEYANLAVEHITIAIWILALDALVVVPFSKLRAENRPTLYAVIKIGNVALNLALNIFFLVYLPKWATSFPVLQVIYIENYQVGYIFIANLLASLFTFLVLSPDYLKGKRSFNKQLWLKMTTYALPVLFSGIAFAINEHLDKILLEKLLPDSIAKSEVGAYSACYKLALFMTLYAAAFRLGIEPFFFSHAKNKNAPQTYAKITKYFVIIGCVIFFGVIVFADLLKILLLRDKSYWEAMKVVPLILLANFFLGIYTNLSVWYKLTDRTNIGAWISLVGAAITLLLNFSLIPHFEKTSKDGYMGSAIATLAAYGTMMLISYTLGKKYYPIPYEIGKVLFYLVTAVIFSGTAFYIFPAVYFVTLPLFGLFLLMVYFNEKADFTKILKKKSSGKVM